MVEGNCLWTVMKKSQDGKLGRNVLLKKGKVLPSRARKEVLWLVTKVNAEKRVGRKKPTRLA